MNVPMRFEGFRHLRSEQNLGAAANFNRSFELSSGDYFKWVAADDIIEPDYLRACVDAFRDGPESLVLCFPRRRFLNPDGSVHSDCAFEARRKVDHATRDIRTLTYRELLQIEDVDAPAIIFGLYRGSILRKTELFRPYLAADLVLYSEMALYGDIWQLPERLHNTRKHAADSERAQMSRKSETRWYDPGGRGGVVRNMGWHLLREHALRIARSEIPASQKLARLLDLRSVLPTRTRMAVARARCRARVRLIKRLTDGSQPNMLPLRTWIVARRLRQADVARWKPELDEARTMSEEEILQHFLNACVDTKTLEPLELAVAWLQDSDRRKREASLNVIRERPESFRSLERRDFTTKSHRVLDEALAQTSAPSP